VFPGWCFFLLASRRKILLRNRSNFLGLKCVCIQQRLFLVNKRLLYQILSINENACTWFDILTVQKCQLQWFQFRSARLAMWIVTRSAHFSSVRSGSARLGSACSVNSHSLGPVQLGPVRFSSTPLGLRCEWGLWVGSACNGNSHSLGPVQLGSTGLGLQCEWGLWVSSVRSRSARLGLQYEWGLRVMQKILLQRGGQIFKQCYRQQDLLRCSKLSLPVKGPPITLISFHCD
jgi:hypothetical protein